MVPHFLWNSYKVIYELTVPGEIYFLEFAIHLLEIVNRLNVRRPLLYVDVLHTY